jgi:hypothetical protein
MLRPGLGPCRAGYRIRELRKAVKEGAEPLPEERLLHLALRAAPVLGCVAGGPVLAVAMVGEVKRAQTAKHEGSSGSGIMPFDSRERGNIREDGQLLLVTARWIRRASLEGGRHNSGDLF